MREGSRHVRYSQRRIRGEKRTLPMYGEGDDAGKYYRCWNCGFICDADRDVTGDGDGRAYTDFTVTSQGSADMSDPVNGFVVLDGINEGHVALKEMADGTTEVITHNFKVQGNACPNCHSQNYK